MHVDGFRFDLATILGREHHGFDPKGGFLDACRQDPLLSQVKLIAEPWDVGPGGYQVGGFPPGWSEWNDHFRRTLRRYWTGEGNIIGELGRRMTGSADLFDHDRRSPRASVNHVTVHDGFTLADLVSYHRKHNLANGEHNRDGSDDNHSTNCGVEGATDKPEILRLRRQLRRNLLASLMLAQGVPLLLAGDEVGNGQRGNNNAYCQDNAVGWVDWSALGSDDEDMTSFVAALTELRRRFPQLRARRWVHGRRTDGSFGVLWLTPQAVEMAAFPARDKDQFAAHWAKLRGDDSLVTRTIVADGMVAGNIGSWPEDGQQLLGYWVGREWWGRGVGRTAPNLASSVDSVRYRR
jgi:glycogen operon protein